MSASTNSLRSAAKPGLEQPLHAVLWAVFAVTCVFYAVLAFDYFIAFGSDREGLWLRLFGALVGREQAFGRGSVHADQQMPYAAGFNFLLMHTTTGALAMALGPFQFMAAARRRYPRLHRDAGKVYLVCVVLSMIGGLAYLGTTPLDSVFSGAPFSIALAGLDVMVLFTAWLAYSAIRRRDIARHRAWMAYNFGLLLATPGLRLLWIAFGWLSPQMDQAASNLAIMTFLLPLCVSGMLLWLAAQPQPLAATTPTANASTDRIAIGWRRAAYTVAAAASLLVAMHHVLRFVLPSDPWQLWLTPEQLRNDAEIFRRTWPLATVYTAASGVAMLSGIGAARAALRQTPTSDVFFGAAAVAAISGALLASWSGAGLLGGATLHVYWWALAGLWLLAILRARSGPPVVARDWTLYTVALAFLPATVLPGIPLWQTLGALDNQQAVITAVTLSFAAHYLLAHYYLYEVARRRTANETATLRAGVARTPAEPTA